MATNIIYKGELNGTQVDFQTGSLTDISTFDTDVRSSAIQNSITDGVTDRGASQDALIAMSGYLAANAHPDVTEAADFDINNADGIVLQSVEFVFDDLGHVTTADFSSINLDNRYYTETEVNAISGAIDTRIDGNDAELTTLRTATGNLNGRINSNDTEISALQAVSGSFQSLTLDNVCDNGATTNQDIQVEDLRVNGGNITGPSTITIDPDSSGPAGTVVIQGDLQVEGTTTTISSTDVQIGDINMVLGTGAANDAAADGGGIIISGTAASTIAEFTYDSTNNRWKTNSLDIEADIVGNSATASKWSSATTLSLAGDLGGSVVFDGSDTTETLTATIAAGAVENDMLAGSIANSKLSNDSVTVSVSSGLTGGGSVDLGSSTSAIATVSDQGHLNKIELGSDNTSISNVVTKGGSLILRGTDNNGISASGTDGNAIDLNDKTTVAFEGVVQSIDTAQDSDNGTYVAMWKIQGVIRRDSDSTDMLSSFVIKTFAGSNASSYGLSVSVNGNGLKIASDQSTATLVTSATINYNWIEETN